VRPNGQGGIAIDRTEKPPAPPRFRDDPPAKTAALSGAEQRVAALELEVRQLKAEIDRLKGSQTRPSATIP
jgi:uncharacterized protein YceH (UPF0502 family)